MRALKTKHMRGLHHASQYPVILSTARRQVFRLAYHHRMSLLGLPMASFIRLPAYGGGSAQVFHLFPFSGQQRLLLSHLRLTIYRRYCNAGRAKKKSICLIRKTVPAKPIPL